MRFKHFKSFILVNAFMNLFSVGMLFLYVAMVFPDIHMKYKIPFAILYYIYKTERDAKDDYIQDKLQKLEDAAKPV